MVGYACAKQIALRGFDSEAQSHSCEWLRPGIENEVTPPRGVLR